MVQTIVDSALEELSWLIKDDSLSDSLAEQIQAFQVDLRLLKLFLGRLVSWDPVKDTDFNSRSLMLSSIEGIWEKPGEGIYAAGLLAIHKRWFKDWNLVASKLGDKIQLFKHEFKKWCVDLISCSLRSMPFSSDQLLDFIDEILTNMKHVHLSETPKEKLLLLRNIVDFASGRCPNLKDFMIHVHTWANKVACLICLYWAGGVVEEDDDDRLLVELMREVNPCTTEFIGMCFQVMKSTKMSRSDTFVFGQVISSFIDFLLENLSVTLKDDVGILCEGLIFLISFFADPPAEDCYASKSLQSHSDVLLSEASHLIHLSKDRPILLGFLEKIHNVRRHIEKLHVQIPSFNLPRTNRLGFVEHLLTKFRDLTETMNNNPKIAPFARHKIFRVTEEVVSLSRSIHVIWELQKEHQEMKDELDRMVYVAYQAEIFVCSSFTIDHPIWYHLSCLSYVLGEMKDVQNEFVKIKINEIYGSGVVVSKQPSIYIPSASGFDEIVVGFHDEEQILNERITRGTAQLEIVPIVGMGGLGKTTLAKKLFNETRSHFNVRAFCYVGQENHSTRILLEILKEFIVIDEGVRAMTRDDLAHRLNKCLRGRKYLILMDDIWDVGAWIGVKDAFPEESNGSRVVFTTRISNVAQQAQSYCTPHYLRFLTIDESWELLQAKVFPKQPCPQHLHEVGKLIAEKCNGLPLAVVVIGGLLAKIPASIASWNGIAHDLNSYASTLGCMDALESSYRHLPEALKSCLLYFGAFVKEKNISAKRLMLLWAAEGFLPTKASERHEYLRTAKQYLNDLVDRSLVIVYERGSADGVKYCGVHDLIRDLCQTNAQNEHFFHFISNDTKICSMHDQYRLCIHVRKESKHNAEAKKWHPTAHALLYHPVSDKIVYSKDLSLPFSNFKLLQTLDLQEVVYGIYESFPKEVTLLVLLRYLALTGERFRLVPSTIAKLWNLETILLQTKDYNGIYLPETIWLMKRLRHVDVGSNASISFDGDVGNDSSTLPNIESFSSVTIAHGASGEEVLRRLSRVRKLSCCFRPCWDTRKKLHLLPNLKKHLTMLESLNIVSDGVRGRCVFNLPATLKKLSLSKFYLPWSEFSTIIAKLPCLEVLKLRLNAFEGSKWDVENEEFPNLKYLELHELNVAEWIASVDTFPCLEQLIVTYCHNLEMIPACFGEVSSLNSLQVYISNHGAEDSALQIQKEQQDMGNRSLQVRVSETIILPSLRYE